MGHIGGNGKIFWQNKRRGSRIGSLGLGLGDGFRTSGPPCGLGLGDALQLPKRDIAGAVWVFRAPEASAVRRMLSGAATNHHGHLARVKVELLAPTYCVAGCAE